MSKKELKYRVNRMEKCCEKLTKIADKWAVQEQKTYDTQEAIRKDLHKHIENFETHDKEEMLKYSGISSAIQDINKTIGNANNKMYMIMGGAAVFLFFIKFMDIGISVSQGAGK